MTRVQELCKQFTRSEFIEFLKNKDSQQSRTVTAKELNCSTYDLRVIAELLGIKRKQGRPRKDITFKEN